MSFKILEHDCDHDHDHDHDQNHDQDHNHEHDYAHDHNHDHVHDHNYDQGHGNADGNGDGDRDDVNWDDVKKEDGLECLEQWQGLDRAAQENAYSWGRVQRERREELNFRTCLALPCPAIGDWGARASRL